MRLALFGFVCTVLMPVPAHAYIDPGAGSMILQGLLATIAAAFLAIRLYWARIKAFLSGRRGAPKAAEAEHAKSENPPEQ